jgi:carboxymethylenebutenolidase
MEVVEEILEAESDGAPMAILRKRPSSPGSWPFVVMFHDGPGIRGATHDFAVKLAREGFDVAVPDLYHRHGRLLGWELHERQQDPSIAERLWDLLRSLTDAGIQADLDAVLNAVDVDAVDVGAHQPMATIGFCVGARAVFRTMMRFPGRFVAGAMWHPSFLVDDTPDSPHLTAAQLPGRVFIGIGEADQMQPLSSHEPFLQAIATLPGNELATFPGADHGYTWPGWPSFNQPAAEASFDKTVALFRDALHGETSDRS